MNVDLVVHRQLPAKDILVIGDKWKDLYDFFQSGSQKHGLYFYNYKENSLPFYVGKCTAKSFNILGKVWDELDDCERGESWLGKDISLLQEFEFFNSSIENDSLNPWKKLTGKNMKNRIKNFLDNINISFSYLNNIDDIRLLDKILSDVEVILQDKLIKKNILSSKWVDERNLNDPIFAKDYNINPVYSIEGDFIKIDNGFFS